MRILDKAVEMNEDFNPVLIITLELPLTLQLDLEQTKFLPAFIEANKTYDDQQKVGSKR
jgi:hypothetical protein